MDDISCKTKTCRLIRLREVLAVCAMSRATLYRAMKANQFPAQVKLSARSVRWRENEVMAWIDSRIKMRTRTPDEH